jgi:tRNA (cmo5U34)-methyltransferase
MTEFERSNWARAEFSRDYLDKADIYIVERRRVFTITKSFFSHFLSSSGQKKVLDLGCGDGIITHEIIKNFGSITATLVDASDDMLSKARERLAGFKQVSYIKSSFQEIIKGAVDIGEGFHLVVSSMAIHHLALEEKKALFGIIHGALCTGGFFINFDVVLPPTDQLDGWYMKLWKEWMDEKRSSLGIAEEDSTDIIKRYKSLEENKPDLLDDQLKGLIAAGFRNVDCFYKYGIFTLYGGMK